MNDCIVDLLNDHDKRTLLTHKLPLACEMAAKTMPANPAVGIIREQVLIGFFRVAFGADQVATPTGNEKGWDCKVCGQKLSIKTGTKDIRPKLVWTVDDESVKRELENYAPEYDLFVVRVWWGKNTEGIYYIPKSVQAEVLEKLGDSYFHVYTGTNHRGIPLSKEAWDMLREHEDTMRCKINWIRPKVVETPYEKWEEFWKS